MIAEPMACLGTRRRIAESILGPVDWESDAVGLAECPGVDLHSTPTGRRDCRVAVDGAPTVYCVHASCHAAVESANRRLRSDTGRSESDGNGEWRYRTWTPAEIDRQRRKDERAELTERARVSLGRVLKENAIAPTDLWNQSPTSLVGVDEREYWRWFLGIFDPAAVVWIGEPTDSGSASHANRFRPLSEWLDQESHPGTRITPATFSPGSFSRCKDSVDTRPFFVVESDTLGFRDQCAVIQFVRRFFRLRAVVYSGNRSLHAWFDRAEGEHLSQLEIILPELGVDPAGFRPTQPFRLPGVFREENRRGVDLLYLDTVAPHA